MKMPILMRNLILNNPLMKRYRYSLLRPSQLWIYLTVFAAVIVLLLYINYSFYQTKSDTIDVEKFCRSIYYQLLVIQIVVLWIWAIINSKSALIVLCDFIFSLARSKIFFASGSCCA